MTIPFENVPDDLKSFQCWVTRKGKTPFNPLTGEGAKAGVTSTWTSFETAVNAYLNESYDGIGFEFSNNGIVGIDLDHVRDKKTGLIKPEADQIVKKLNSYTEISPSGEGLHIFVYGNIPSSGRKHTKRGIEIYKDKRYFTVTGNVYGDYCKMEHREREIMELYNELFPQAQAKQNIPAATANNLEHGLKCDKVLSALWNGERTTSDESSNDMALMNKLAY